MSEDKLTRDDLVLLMESYRNMITMHQTILDQTAKTIDKLDSIATKQDNLFSKQSSICNSIQDISNRLGTTSNKMEKMEDKLSKKVDDHESKRVDSDNKITNKIYLGWVGMGTIIIGLIGLMATISQFVHAHPQILP